MTVPSYNINTSSALIVPDSHGLIITSGKDPGELIVEVCGTNIVDMAFQSEQTTFLFIIPDLNETIVTSWDEEGELGMEVDASDSAIVLLFWDGNVLQIWRDWFWDWNPKARWHLISWQWWPMVLRDGNRCFWLVRFSFRILVCLCSNSSLISKSLLNLI